MLKLKQLRLKAIGRFVEEQTVNIETLGNLIQVDGQNQNTGGSSGSGKTTVFNALDFLLGLNDLPTTVLQSRLTKEKMTVSGHFDWDGKNVTIERGAKLSIEIDGNVTVGSSALTEAKLDEILGMPRDIFRKILHKRQKEGGFFLDFTPKKMYEFLTNVLNLAAERKKLEKVEIKLTDLEKQKNSRQSSILQAQSSLKAMQEAILGLGLPPIRDIHQSVILELKGKTDDSTKRYKETEEAQKQQTQEIDSQRPHITVQPFDLTERRSLEVRRETVTGTVNARLREESERVNGVRASISAITLEQSNLGYQVRDGETCKLAAIDIAGQVKKIREAICFTCEQSWITENAKKTEGELLVKLAGHKEKIATAAKATARLAVLATELATLQEQLKPQNDAGLLPMQAEIHDIGQAILADKAKEQSHLKIQNEMNGVAMQAFAVKQVELRKSQTIEMDQVRGQADVDRRAFEAAISKLKSYDEAFKKYETTMSYMKANEAVYLGDLAENEVVMSALLADIEMAEELKKAVKTFISCAFDDALDVISDAATKIIRCIPTMANATIQFEGQKETQDGKIKEEVNAVISMDGDIGISIKSLSGGERSSVDLAVDLAVIDFIESESAKGIDVFILDEPFTGLDTVSIEMALEVLKNSNSTKKLIVVDHNPEVKQMVSNRIVVVRYGNTSSISKE